VPERNPEGEIVGFIGIMVDISERREMEEDLRQKEANHQAILGAVPDLMMRVRRDGTCLESIPPKSACAGTFLPIEKHISEVLPPKQLQKQLQAIEQTLATGEVQVYEHQIKKFDRVFDEEVRISPLGEEEVLILVCDIAKRKQAEREIDRLFSLSPDLLCIANFEGYFLRLNPVWERVLGYTHAELMATPYLEFVHPEDRARTLAQAEKIAKGATVIEFENRYRCWDGSYRWLLWMAAPFVETGTIYCVAHDITDRKETEIALQQSEQRLNLALSAANAGVWDWNMQTDETSYSSHLSTLFGMSHDAFDGKYETLFSLVYPEDRKAVKQAVRQAIEKGISYEIEFRVVWADGSLHWIGSRGKVFYDEIGRPLRMIGVDKDISKRKQAEEALRLAEENYRSIFENALEGIFQSTPEGQYIRVNPSMASIHGYESPEQMIAMVKKIDQQIYVHPREREEFLGLMAERGEVKEFEYQARRADGRIIWLEQNTRTVVDCAGNLLYYEGIIQDITQRKQEEQALKRNVKKLIVEIDQQRRQREVAEIMQTDYFRELQAQVDKLRLPEGKS
jgi:PAS domain S-box-containing protein